MSSRQNMMPAEFDEYLVEIGRMTEQERIDRAWKRIIAEQLARVTVWPRRRGFYS